jgi:hypothetical protein
MPVLNSLAKTIVKPIPRMISPAAHAVADYIAAGAFLVGAGIFWSRSNRAALAALICGGAELAVNLMTDYPDGVTKAISFRAHEEIDIGLGAWLQPCPSSWLLTMVRKKGSSSPRAS